MAFNPTAASALVRPRSQAARRGRSKRPRCRVQQHYTCSERPAFPRLCAPRSTLLYDAIHPRLHRHLHANDQVPKVLSSRFHATTRAAAEPPPAKRARRNDPCASSDGLPQVSSAADAADAPQPATYRTFATQQAAFDFWDAQRPRTHLLRAFAVEHDASGRRSFIVATPARFWAEYRALPHAQRNHYEVRERFRGGGWL
jgi:hypothetical protein